MNSVVRVRRLRKADRHANAPKSRQLVHHRSTVQTGGKGRSANGGFDLSRETEKQHNEHPDKVAGAMRKRLRLARSCHDSRDKRVGILSAVRAREAKIGSVSPRQPSTASKPLRRPDDLCAVTPKAARVKHHEERRRNGLLAAGAITPARGQWAACVKPR